MRIRQGVRGAIAEGAVIVVSIVLALAADAWWDGRQEHARAREHLEALRRDFNQMSARADSSLVGARRAVESGLKVERAIGSRGITADPDSLLTWVGWLFYYEAFSPSVGGYEALIASGDLEHLGDPDLRRVLSEFFGSFEDMRVSERLLVDAQAGLMETDDFARLIGAQRIFAPYIKGLPPTGAPPVDRWSESPVLVSGIANLIGRQLNVMDDYTFLHSQLEEVQKRIGP